MYESLNFKNFQSTNYIQLATLYYSKILFIESGRNLI